VRSSGSLDEQSKGSSCLTDESCNLKVEELSEGVDEMKLVPYERKIPNSNNIKLVGK
jgi:hypothetical protein